MSELAILGGKPLIKEIIPSYQSLGKEEIVAVNNVMSSGVLSGFYGSWSDEFFGGEEVKHLEKKWSSEFKVKYSISVNSNTSGLIAAIGACGIGPGDEVIVPPLTMSATAMAPIFYGAIPVFADVEAETFCLDVEQVRKNITPKTKAIIAVNLFGHPARLKELKKLANENSLRLIEDNAQAPFAKEDNAYTGTVGDIGVFSLNYHKHIHSGEGGVCVTNDENLARRMSLIRNHAENIVEPIDLKDITNMVGMNLRMTELSAAIAGVQLEKGKELISGRQGIARKLSGLIIDIEGMEVPAERSNCDHVYYMWALKYCENSIGVNRDIFAKALVAEGVPVGIGYVKPLYKLPLFRNKIAIGNKGYPFNLTKRNYDGDLCPVAEQLHKHELITIEICSIDPTSKQIDDMAAAFYKVYKNRNELINFDKAE